MSNILQEIESQLEQAAIKKHFGSAVSNVYQEPLRKNRLFRDIYNFAPLKYKINENDLYQFRFTYKEIFDKIYIINVTPLLVRHYNCRCRLVPNVLRRSKNA